MTRNCDPEPRSEREHREEALTDCVAILCGRVAPSVPRLMVPRIVRAIDQHARKLHALYEQTCNGTIEEADYERKVGNERDLIALHWSELKWRRGKQVYVVHQTDPRGWPLILTDGPKAGTSGRELCRLGGRLT
jgi:hypothetical protein